mmetsp:Transcript_22593/g.55052  ORF Transcript_22593/g.55052 Transcript_22593/m.55052 type:complete len:345 (-) Transcript_22593:3372-4406(-)
MVGSSSFQKGSSSILCWFSFLWAAPAVPATSRRPFLSAILYCSCSSLSTGVAWSMNSLPSATLPFLTSILPIAALTTATPIMCPIPSKMVSASSRLCTACRGWPIFWYMKAVALCTLPIPSWYPMPWKLSKASLRCARASEKRGVNSPSGTMLVLVSPISRSDSPIRKTEPHRDAHDFASMRTSWLPNQSSSMILLSACSLCTSPSPARSCMALHISSASSRSVRARARLAALIATSARRMSACARRTGLASSRKRATDSLTLRSACTRSPSMALRLQSSSLAMACPMVLCRSSYVVRQLDASCLAILYLPSVACASASDHSTSAWPRREPPYRNAMISFFTLF